MQKMYEE
jgi:hypothetical protein